MTVHLVQYQVILNQDDDRAETELVGVYSSRGAADACVQLVRPLPRFAGRPGRFYITPCEVDHTGWQDGFVTEVIGGTAT